MKNLMRNLTLSAAALAALVSIAPKADAQDWGRARGFESPRREFRGQERREFRGQEFRGNGRGEFRGREFRGSEFRGRDFRGRDFRGGEFRGNGWGGHAFFRPSVGFRGRGFISPFRVFAGSRFYSYCPGPGYLYVNELGWVFPPFPGAVWVPAHYDYDGFWIEGCWR